MICLFDFDKMRLFGLAFVLYFLQIVVWYKILDFQASQATEFDSQFELLWNMKIRKNIFYL